MVVHVGRSCQYRASRHGRHHRLDAEDVERPPQIIDERGQTELGADIVEALHQKGALVHPYVDGPLLASCWAVL